MPLTDNTFNNAAGDNRWDTPGNWSLLAIPNSTHRVVINPALIQGDGLIDTSAASVPNPTSVGAIESDAGTDGNPDDIGNIPYDHVTCLGAGRFSHTGDFNIVDFPNAATINDVSISATTATVGQGIVGPGAFTIFAPSGKVWLTGNTELVLGMTAAGQVTVHGVGNTGTMIQASGIKGLVLVDTATLTIDGSTSSYDEVTDAGSIYRVINGGVIDFQELTIPSTVSLQVGSGGGTFLNYTHTPAAPQEDYGMVLMLLDIL